MSSFCGISLVSSKSQMFQQITNKTSTGTPLAKLAFTNPGVCQVILTFLFSELNHQCLSSTKYKFMKKLNILIEKKK
jgi:hypothetical protein